MLRPTLAVARINHPAATRTTALVRRTGSPSDPRREAVGEALRDAAADIAAEVRRQLRA
jgi:hypothetical protein